MKYCDDYAALLDLYVDGELSPEEMIRVQAHLDQCPGCRAYVDDALAIRAAFPEVEETEVPEGFAEGVMARIQMEAAPKKKRRAPWAKALLPLAACCAVVILLQSGPGLFAGRKEEAASASAPMDTAAPAMTTESVAEKLEEPASPEMERQKTADSTVIAPTAEAPAECEVPKEDAASDAPYTFMASGTVYAAKLSLPSEGAELLGDYTPLSESSTEAQYELTAAEADALLVQLDAAKISYQSEEGIDPTTDMVLVILSK